MLPNHIPCYRETIHKRRSSSRWQTSLLSYFKKFPQPPQPSATAPHIVSSHRHQQKDYGLKTNDKKAPKDLVDGWHVLVMPFILIKICISCLKTQCHCTLHTLQCSAHITLICTGKPSKTHATRFIAIIALLQWS